MTTLLCFAHGNRWREYEESFDEVLFLTEDSIPVFGPDDRCAACQEEKEAMK